MPLAVNPSLADAAASPSTLNCLVVLDVISPRSSAARCVASLTCGSDKFDAAARFASARALDSNVPGRAYLLRRRRRFGNPAHSKRP